MVSAIEEFYPSMYAGHILQANVNKREGKGVSAQVTGEFLLANEPNRKGLSLQALSIFAPEGVFLFSPTPDFSADKAFQTHNNYFISDISRILTF